MMQRVINGLLAALLLVSAGAIFGVPRADAFVIWCWDDPIVKINGQVLYILNGVQGEPALVTTHIKSADTTIFVPPGTQYETLGVTKNFFPETVRWVVTGDDDDDDDDRRGAETAKKTRVRIVTSFNASRNFPAAMQVKKNLADRAALATDTGSTNGRPLTVQITLR